MSLNVEDGTGLSTSESYASVSDADTRLGNLGMTIWSPLQTSEKEAALRRATNYLEQAYRESWKGLRLHKDQALSWPRWDVLVDNFPTDPNSVPPEVKNACIDLALKAAAGDLNADLTRGVITKKIGPIETQYDRYSPQSVRYPSIDQQLRPFLRGSGANAMLVRA
jgi:hypothetical protein